MDDVKINQIIKKISWIIIGIILFAWAIFNPDTVNDIWNNILKILQPFLFGILMALLLHAPVKFFEEKLAKKDKKGNVVTNKNLAVTLSVITVFLTVVIVFSLVIPGLINFGKIIVNNMPIYTQKVTEIVEDIGTNHPELNMNDLSKQISQNIQNIGKTLTDELPKILSNSLSTISGTINGIINFFIGIGFAIMILTQKDRINLTSKKLFYTYVGKEKTMKMIRVIDIFIDSFSNFIVARSINSFIVGLLCIIISLIAGVPNAISAGILVGFTNLIPIFGAIIGIVISMIMIVAILPIKALVFLIIGMIVWQLGENIFLPYLIGKKVGMSDFLQFIVVTAGGSMFGILGILFGVPVVNTVYILMYEKAKNTVIE